jgi:recombinational DNA repair protein RecR
MASQEIETLAAALARLPGLGPRSARRAVLWLVKRRESALPALLEALATVGEANATPAAMSTPPTRAGSAAIRGAI